MKIRAAIIWFSLGALWLADTGLAWRRHDLRHVLVAGIAAAAFLGAGFYYASRQKRKPRSRA